MTSLEIIKKLGLLDWPELFIGWKKSWVSLSDISNFAVNCLSQSDDINIAILASSNSLSHEEIQEAFERVLELINSSDLDEKQAIEKWRLAKLIELEVSSNSEEEKIDKLQQLYADFDYPEDMEKCSIYSSGNIPPLAEMHQTIISLKDSLNVL